MTENNKMNADEDDLLVGAPSYTTKISFWRAIFATVGLVTTAWLFLSPYQSGGWIGAGTAFVTLLVVGASTSSVNDRLSKSYATELLTRAGLEQSDENISRANAVFNTRKSSNTFQLIAFLLAWVGLSAASLIGLTDFRGAGVDSISAFGTLILQIIFSSLLVGGCFLAAISIALTDRPEDISFSPQATGQSATLALHIEDRNDIDIAGLGVALQAVMRRAEAYTIESTLLSGLSFSAFIGIAFSDGGPIENASWIRQAISTMSCAKQETLGLSYCVYNVAPLVVGHEMFIVAGLMLICAMLFMSAIIIRFRFNEAFRHTEEILAIAKVLNDKEVSSQGDAKSAITLAITNYRKGEGRIPRHGPAQLCNEDV